MKKKLFSRAGIAMLLIVAMAGSTLTAFAGMSNFTTNQTYPGFKDVASSSWYYSDVSKSCKLGLFNGYPDGSFKPTGNITIAEAIKVAAVVRATYEGETPPANSKSELWYSDYVAYAKTKGIIGSSDFSNYNNKAKRNEMAYIFSKALPSSEYSAINSVTVLPDVTASTRYGSSIFTLYNAGVLKGNDDYGTFRPNDYINRAEAAAIINRVAQAGNRVAFTLKTKTEPPSTGGVMTEAQTVTYIQNYLNSVSEDKLIGQPLDSLQKQLLAKIKADPKNCYPEFNSVENFNFTQNGSSIIFYTKFVSNVLMCGGDINNYDPGLW